MADLSSLRRTVRGIEFPYPVMIAGGVVKTAEQVRRYAPTEIIPEWGSIESEPSSGNGGRDYHAEYAEVPGGGRVLMRTQNSLGLPNPGMKYVEQHAPDLIKLYADNGKPLAINVSGKSVEDVVTLVGRAITCGFRFIIVNGSCPNRVVKGMPSAPICVDRDSIIPVFDLLQRRFSGTDALVLWKVSVGLPRPILEFNCEMVRHSPVFGGMVTGNTFPSTLDYDAFYETTILTENKIDRGGMAGPAIRPIALDNTNFCSQQLASCGKIVFGCGGAQDAHTIRKFLLAGAAIVQMHSAFREANEDPTFVRDILAELAQD